MSGTRTTLAAVLFVAGTLTAPTQNEPIQGPEDAKCRDEARNLVFSAPNPKRLSPRRDALGLAGVTAPKSQGSEHAVAFDVCATGLF